MKKETDWSERVLDDSSLVEHARQGNGDAYDELVRRYQTLAFRVAYLTLHDPEEAEDVVQEAFVKAYFALDRFRAGAPFRPWLLRIVANEARNRRDWRRRRGIGTMPDLTLALNLPAEGAADPEREALDQERQRELIAILNQLAVDDRQVIALRYFLDLSEAEMATVLDCARGTVKSRLSRALARCRAIMSAHDKEHLTHA